jgi:hypothetical protein
MDATGETTGLGVFSDDLANEVGGGDELFYGHDEYLGLIYGTPAYERADCSTAHG